MRILAEDPRLVGELRADPELIPNFVDECLRMESPIKGAFRLAIRDAEIAGVAIPMSSFLMAMNGAANRDSRVFDDPDRFDVRRRNARRHIAFGHGEHFCPVPAPRRASASSDCSRDSTTSSSSMRARSAIRRSPSFEV
jgi:cytochrome P450